MWFKGVSAPTAGLIAGAVMISFSSVMVKLSHVDPVVSAFYRVFFGGLCLLPVCLLKNEFHMIKKQHLLMAACGCLFSLDLWAYHMSIDYVGPGLATLLASFQVFILSLAGVLFFKEELRLAFILSLPLAMLGLYLLAGADAIAPTTLYWAGIALGLAAAFFYGLFLLLMRVSGSGEEHKSQRYDLMVLSFVCAGCLGIKAYYQGASFAIPDVQTLFSLFGLGLFVQAAAWLVIATFLPRVKASRAGLILLLQPSLAFCWDVLFFNRVTGFTGWAGFFMVLVAIYLGMRHKGESKT